MLKRLFDITLATLLLLLLGGFLFVFWIASALDTRSTGLFLQQRIGQYGKKFTILKLRTFHIATGKVSSFGQFVRRHKIDEFPQLINILKGDMSFVGPRPDVPGYYDKLDGENQKILLLKPGLTCEASIKYYNEEAMLAQQENPQQYNDTVIFPDKVKMNLNYYYHRSFVGDLWILWKTIFR
ncbi:sugar transferase [Flavobacterium sedimenticola]|uniref:Sugar transferase n=1 Tax=Flavobacterium sedimenticola TaxID=3043286 RepID=A0ABT6XRI4_9FLAO|nr:sugar transferase [Flavobacterium sedimenticola]MDI9257690.1 sugar transferase [Flavobacterium sedimenticola]